MEMITAITEDNTEAAPLSPQSHGVACGANREAIIIPVGNAIPAASPRGARRATEMAMRNPFGAAIKS